MKEFETTALKDNLPEVLTFVEEQLTALGCSKKIIMQIDIAVEEIFVNIASYAYDPQIGPAVIRTEITEEPLSVIISFVDSGRPYDPLARPDPDVHLPASERRIGGLGIFMVKKSMDDVSYEYKDGQNILTIKKQIDG
ncbi:MAG: ATP-binding protein [Ruminococcus sp.]|nr:ATP-binding protein [Ruminococcus sp.]